MVIGKTGRDIPKSQADSYIAGYGELLVDFEIPSQPLTTALAIDMTARNIQDAVKKKGLPWSTAKGFDTFLPIG